MLNLKNKLFKIINPELSAKYEEANKRVKILEAIQKISATLVDNLSTETIIQKAADAMSAELGFAGGNVFIKKENEDFLSAVATSTNVLALTAQKLLESILGFNLLQIHYELSVEDNLIVKAYHDKTIYTSNALEDLAPQKIKPASKIIKKFANIKAVVAVPFIYKNEVVGMADILSHREAFSKEELNLIKIYADLCAIVINNSRLFGKIEDQVTLLKRSNAELETLFNLTSKITQSLDPNQVLQIAVNTIPTDETLIGSAVAIYNDPTKELSLAAVSENELTMRVRELTGDFSKYKININNEIFRKNPIHKVITNAKGMLIEDVSQLLDPVLSTPLVKALLRLTKFDSCYILPLLSKGFPSGVIFFLFKGIDSKSLDSHTQLLTTYANQISIALENALLYEKSQEIQARLIEARRRERDMIDVMGHELRTPISIVRNALLTLRMDYEKDQKIEDMSKLGKYLDMAIESTKREIRLIETLLSATKVEGNKLQLDLTKVDMLDVINDALEGQQAIANDKGLTIKYDPPAGEFFAYADRVRAKEIMDNFLSNAVKYTAQGEVAIYIWEENNKIFIEIKDTGIGIGEEDLKNLGKKFFRAKELFEGTPGQVQPSGTGLGLFVTFALIEMMGGEKTIKSEKGKGSSFKFGLPKYTGQEDKQISQTMNTIS